VLPTLTYLKGFFMNLALPMSISFLAILERRARCISRRRVEEIHARGLER